MRTLAIENLLKHMVNAVETNNTAMALHYATKARIVLDRDNNRDASVIREMVNQSVELCE